MRKMIQIRNVSDELHSELRANFSCYEAAYVALAEVLGAALHSEDERLIGAVRAHTEVRVDR